MPEGQDLREPLRAGLLGAGRIGVVHAETLRDHAEVGELLVADIDQARARAVAEKVGATAAPDVEAVFAAGIDVVVIASATSAHAELVHRAADAGVAVFCEKPLGLGVVATRAVVDHVRRAGIRLQVGFQRRFDAGYRAARAALGAGEIGTLHTVRMIGADPAPPPAAYVPTSGGIFRDMHIHDFDILRWVTGREVVSAYAVGANRGAEMFAAAGDVDVTAILLTLDDGTLVTLAGSRYNGAGYDVRMELAGTKAVWAAGLDDRTPLRSAERGVGWPDGQPYTSFLDRFGPAYQAELAAFVDYARGRIPSPCTGADALAALLVAEACERSRREGRPVAVEEVAG
jgi:myo-inositol 2-dehydrogenase / D-chiro-inositol 1-dehydrogenase